MGFLQPSNQLPVHTEKKQPFKATGGFLTIANAILQEETMMEDCIEAYDIAWEIRYAKDLNTYNRQQFNRIMKKEIPVDAGLYRALETMVREYYLSKI